MPHARLHAQDTVLLKVILNTEDRGEYYVTLTDGGDVLFTRAQLQQLGINTVQRPAGAGPDPVSLRSLAPGVSYELIEGEASVTLTVDPRLLGTQVKDLAHGRRPDVLYPEMNSFVLNYTVTYDVQQNDFLFPLELAARAGSFLLLTDGTGTVSANGERTSAGQNVSLVRNMTSVILDSRSGLTRGILGDLTATSGGMGLGSSAILGGVSFARNFSIDPYFLKEPGAGMSALLPAPASVQMFLNDVPAGGPTKFTSGGIQFINIPLPPGSNTVGLQMTDMAGLVSRLQQLYYVGTGLLAPGVQEYSYNLGFTRQDLGIRNFDYGEPAFLGFHRMGISNWLTFGARVEASPTTLNAGPIATMTLGLLGELNTALAVSDNDGARGYGAVAEYDYQGRSFGGSLSIRYMSDEYSTVATPGSGMVPTVVANLSFGFRDKLIGSLGASATCSIMQDGTNTELFTASYSRELWGNLQLQAILDGQLQAGNLQIGGFVGVRILLGDALAGISSRFENGATGVSADIEHEVTRGNGFGYNGTMEEVQGSGGDRSFDGQAALDYHGSYGNLGAAVAYDQVQNRPDIQLSGAGSIVAIDGTIHLAQPIVDDFALVRVDGLRGVRIKYGTQYVGVTDGAGNALIPGLSSYSENELSIEQADVPMDHTIESTQAWISPPSRGGGVVEFKTVKFKALSGRLFFIEKGQRTAADFAGLDVEVQGGTVSSVVGLGGAFYLENIPVGTYPARLYTQDKESRFQLVVPESSDTVVDIGEIDCAVQGDTGGGPAR